MHTIFKDISLQRLLPIDAKDLRPVVITYRTTEPFSRQVINYSGFLRHLTQNRLTDILCGTCNCCDSEFLYKSCGHIVTGDLHIVILSKILNFVMLWKKVPNTDCLVKSTGR